MAATMRATDPGEIDQPAGGSLGEDAEGDQHSGEGYSIPYAASRDSALASSVDTLRLLEEHGSSATRKLDFGRQEGHQGQRRYLHLSYIPIRFSNFLCWNPPGK
jgi:hypothetical protein